MKNYPKLVRDSNFSLKLLTFQLSNVRELETIKYAFDWTALPHEWFQDWSLIWSIHIPVWPKYLHSYSHSEQKISCRSLKILQYWENLDKSMILVTQTIPFFKRQLFHWHTILALCTERDSVINLEIRVIVLWPWIKTAHPAIAYQTNKLRWNNINTNLES